ncbi:MAG: HAD-IC family P-type ATPase, partial [Gammaproteobacteria bacterium]|nr:HAD-IC family P-type ATPase [Gammaproteobacteria bacterium]
MSLVESPHSQSIETVAAAMGVTPEHGLEIDEAASRIEKYGHNIIEGSARTSFLQKFINQFRDVMIVILLLAATLAAVMGEISDTSVILVIVILNAIIGSAQEFRAERTLDALRKMTSPNISVRRGGHLHHIDTADLVPGDIVYLEAGNIVPGDLRLFKTVDLEVDEAPLTGESLPVTKTTVILDDKDAMLGDRHNMAYKGTNVTRGRAMGVTVSTGAETELGRIATMLQDSKTVMTPLQVRLGHFGRRLALAVTLIAALVFVSGLLRGEELMLMLLTAISLAVAGIPEALPAVISISLAIGANKMSRHNALMRRLSAVETLGSVTFICSDKTGTLTLNEMRLAILQADGRQIDSLNQAGDRNELWQLLGQA